MKEYTSKQITEDFVYLKKKIEEVHPNPFLFTSKYTFNKNIDDLALKLEKLDYITFFFELMSIFAKLRDSHTRVTGIERILSEIKYPIRFKCLEGNYYISSIDIKKKEHIGSKVLYLNKTPIEEALSKMSKVFAHENEIVLSNTIEQWIYEPDFLKYIGIIDKSLKLEIKTENNKIELTPSKFPEEELYNPRKVNLQKSETLRPKGLYWTKYFKEFATYYLQYNECEDITKEEIRKIIEEIKEKDTKFVVIDLRNNVGGSSLILDPLTNFLYENQGRYIPVVLLSNLTYSAAIINALNILDCKDAISIGTKTAGSPTRFGQTTMITLPNTKIDITISTKFFEENGYKFGKPLVPKIQTEQTIEQYLNAIDVDWEKFLQQRLLITSKKILR